MSKKIRVGHIGARMYYGVPRAIYHASLLEKLYTDITINKGLPKFISKLGFTKGLALREVKEIPSNKIMHLPLWGFRNFWRLSQAKNENQSNTANFNNGMALERFMMRDNLANVDAVMMVGSSSQHIFEFAKTKGIATVKEQIIAPAGIYNAIIAKYLGAYSTWENVPYSETSAAFWQDVATKEWQFTDHVICGSQFVKDSIVELGYSAEKVEVIPYGVPLLMQKNPCKEYDGKRKLRILFVGTVCLRKGIQYLLEIAESLQATCEIKICGKSSLNREIHERYGAFVDFVGHIPRTEISSYYEWADVFVLPTLFEGSATVCYEAIQYKIPIITTVNSGVFLNDGEGVQLIEMGSSSSLKKAIENYVEHPELVKEHSQILEKHMFYASTEAYMQRIEAFFKDKVFA
tara:strand:- start:163758 stop:164972 length:1215 start_codon:yes stop_codon:yes gene_type:complete